MSRGHSRMPSWSSDQRVKTGTYPVAALRPRVRAVQGLGAPSADRSGVERSRRSSLRSGRLGRIAKGGSRIRKW
jgi:hypothetical protein